MNLDEPGVTVGGVAIAPVTEDEVKRWIATSIEESPRPGRRVSTVNLDFLVLAGRNPAFRAALESAHLALADGRPLLWLAKMRGKRLPERVAGADVTQWLVDGGVPGARIFLLGSTDAVCRAVVARARSGRADIVGWNTAAREALDDPIQAKAVIGAINASRADVLLTALGAPRQDLWMAAHAEEFDVSVMIGVGGSLDLVAGRLRRAPWLLRRIGLEWAFRMVQEPRRLWRRYLVDDLPFLVREMVATLAGRRR